MTAGERALLVNVLENVKSWKGQAGFHAREADKTGDTMAAKFHRRYETHLMRVEGKLLVVLGLDKEGSSDDERRSGSAASVGSSGHASA